MNIEKFAKAEKNKREITESVNQTIQDSFEKAKKVVSDFFDFPLIKEFLNEERTSEEKEAFKKKIDSLSNAGVSFIEYDEESHHLKLLNELRTIQMNQNFTSSIEEYILNKLLDNPYAVIIYKKDEGGNCTLIENVQWFLYLDDFEMETIRSRIEEQEKSIPLIFKRNLSIKIQLRTLEELEALLVTRQ